MFIVGFFIMVLGMCAIDADGLFPILAIVTGAALMLPELKKWTWYQKDKNEKRRREKENENQKRGSDWNSKVVNFDNSNLGNYANQNYSKRR